MTTTIKAAELRAAIVRMLRAGRGESVEPEASEPPIEKRDGAQNASATRRTPNSKSRKQS